MKLLEHERITRINLIEQGYSDRQIAKMLNVTVQAIQNWRSKNGFPPNYKIVKVNGDECK